MPCRESLSTLSQIADRSAAMKREASQVALRAVWCDSPDQSRVTLSRCEHSNLPWHISRTMAEIMESMKLNLHPRSSGRR